MNEVTPTIIPAAQPAYVREEYTAALGDRITTHYHYPVFAWQAWPDGRLIPIVSIDGHHPQLLPDGAYELTTDALIRRYIHLGETPKNYETPACPSDVNWIARHAVTELVKKASDA